LFDLLIYDKKDEEKQEEVIVSTVQYLQ